MHKVKRMTQQPVACLTCGRGNIPDEPHTEDEFWCLDLERDVNWGDSTYLCMYCCEKIGITAGLVSSDDLKEQLDINRALSRKVHDLTARLDAKTRRLDAVSGGARAIRQEKKQRQREATQSTVEELRDRTKKRKAPST